MLLVWQHSQRAQIKHRIGLSIYSLCCVARMRACLGIMRMRVSSASAQIILLAELEGTSQKTTAGIMDRNCVSSTCLRRRRGSTSVGSSGLHYLVCSAVIISVIILQLPSASFAAGSSAGSGEGRDGSSSGSGTAPGSIPLNFIFLSSDNPRLRTSGSIPAVDIALEMVTQSRILGKYKLQYTEALDSQVSDGDL